MIVSLDASENRAHTTCDWPTIASCLHFLSPCSPTLLPHSPPAFPSSPSCPEVISACIVARLQMGDDHTILGFHDAIPEQKSGKNKRRLFPTRSRYRRWDLHVGEYVTIRLGGGQIKIHVHRGGKGHLDMNAQMGGALVSRVIIPPLHEKRHFSPGGIQWESVSYMLQMTSGWENERFYFFFFLSARKGLLTRVFSFSGFLWRGSPLSFELSHQISHLITDLDKLKPVMR